MTNLQYIHLMKYNHENEQFTTTQNNIDEYYYHNVDGKKPKQKSLYCIISFIKKVEKQAKQIYARGSQDGGYLWKHSD